MNIEKPNCVTPETAAEPRYQPDPADRKIRVYYTGSDQVIIAGVQDNNYIYWLSVTRMDDLALNRNIIAYIQTNEPKLFTSLPEALKKTKFSYENVKGMYAAELRQAEMIVRHYEEIKAMCTTREVRGKYIEILRCYLDMIASCTGDADKDYARHKALIKLIQSEKYLRLSDNETVRKLYKQLEDRCDRLYQDYMTVARGGA